jgi:polyhydroxybutyrate depolymerase
MKAFCTCLMLWLLCLPGAVQARICERPTGSQQVMISGAQGPRAVTVYVPKRLGTLRAPLLIGLHGSGSNGMEFSASSELRALADTHGFIIAAPSGAAPYDDQDAGRRAWNMNRMPLANGKIVPLGTPDDIKHIADIIDTMTAQPCIDARRIYLIGYSGGARMASAAACALSDKIAAIAPIAGLRAGGPLAGDPTQVDTSSCRPTRAMPVIAVHGADDPLNPYAAGGGLYWGYSVPAALARWADINGCKGGRRSRVFAGNVKHIFYAGCPKYAPVELYLVDAKREAGGGHVWPRDHGFNASAVLIQFLLKQRL